MANQLHNSSWIVCIGFMLSAACLCSCASADDVADTIARARAANREGDWRAAAEIYDKLLEREDLSNERRCEVLCGAAHAHLGLRQSERAAVLLGELDTRRTSLPDDHWIQHEYDRLQKRLTDDHSSPPPATERKANRAAPVAGRSAPDLMWSARLANSRSEYAKAIQLTDQVRQMAGIPPVLLGDALLHAFYAHHKSGHVAEREKSLDDFLRIRHQLGEGDRLEAEFHLLLAALGHERATDVSAGYVPIERPDDDFWRRSTPNAHGINAERIAAVEQHCKRSGADAFLIAHHGEIISEWYSPCYTEPIGTMSSAKSITALLAGLLVADGKLSVDDPVSKYLPEWTGGRRGEVRIRHLLTMTSGLLHMSGGGVGFARNKDSYVIGLEPEKEPGSKWSYSNEGVQLLSPILEKAAGRPLHEYAAERLFKPLGMNATRMRVTDDQTITYADAETTLRDFARLGVFVLQEGRWRDRQIILAEWVRACVTPCGQNAGYGYLFWLEQSPRSWSMRGYLDTSVYMFPDLDLVLARMQSKVRLHAQEEFDPMKVADWLTSAMPNTRVTTPTESD